MLETLKVIKDLIEKHDENCDSNFEYHNRITRRETFLEKSYDYNDNEVKNTLELKSVKDGDLVLYLYNYDDFDSLVNDKNYLEEVNQNLEEENKKLKEEIEELKSY